MAIEIAEKSVLGTMLLENHLITDSGMKETHFVTHLHRNTFRRMRNLAANGKPVDYVTILTMGDPAECGGANYLAELNNFANSSRFEEYSEIILTAWKEREKKQVLQQAQTEDWSLENIQKTLDELQNAETENDDLSIVQDLVALHDTPFKPLEENFGTPTGLTDLDKMLDGFQDSEMTIIGARPSMGKTDVLNHLALHAGWAKHLPLVFSLEMNRASMVKRMLAVTGGYNRLRMRDPYKYFSEEQKEKWSKSIGYLSNANMQIDDRSGLTVSQIKAKARQTIKRHPDKRPIIFIDYLQLIRPDNPRAEQTQKIGQISYDLKGMAKEFGCPVVVLSQLSRGVEQRQDKKPVMSDLRDSGNIEQDADVIAFLYREDYYDKESDLQNVMEIIIAKNRNGPTGTVTASYVKETGRLSNIDWSEQA